MRADGFTVKEADLAQRLDVSRDTLRVVRRDVLERDVDFVSEPAGVKYSEAGVRRTLEFLKISTAPAVSPPPAPAESAAGIGGLWRAAREFIGVGTLPAEPAAAPVITEPLPVALPDADVQKIALTVGEVRELKVKVRYRMNRHIVLAEFAGIEARVRMRDNKNLQPGMTMRCRYVGDDLWDLDQRLPRYPGKW